MSSPDDEKKLAEEAFAEFLRRKQKDAGLTIAAFCGENAALGDSLQKLGAQLSRFSGFCRRLERDHVAVKPDRTETDQSSCGSTC